MTTLLAATKLMPSEPAFVEMRSNRHLKPRRTGCYDLRFLGKAEITVRWSVPVVGTIIKLICPLLP